MVEKHRNDDGSYNCPTCGTELNTSLGLKQHHSKVHDESLVDITECNWCGEDFHVKPSQEGNYCSRECHMEYRRENGLPARKRRVDIECKHCGDTFEIQRSEADKRSYCSDECRLEDSNAKNLDCEWCGENFRATGSWADEARFCSQDCYGKWLSGRKSGKNSWHWKGDERKTDRPGYGPGWGTKKREMVRKNANYSCERCGRDESSHQSEYGQNLHVHHLINVDRSTNPAVHNAPRNLQALCIPCHHEEHPNA